MTKQAKVKLIKKFFKEGKIKKLGHDAYTVSSELFVLGIMPRIIHETLNKER